MATKKTPLTEIKARLHPKNKHNRRYNFKQLITAHAPLASLVKLNKYNDESIDFSDSEAILALNSALLKQFYDIGEWEIPAGYLCPPIPGRADYIHHIAELLGGYKNGKPPEGAAIKCLDIGTGANCIYPIIGTKEYGWSFVGSDIDPTSITSATKIVEQNERLTPRVQIKLQVSQKDFFYGVINKEEQIDITICNPPFHASKEEAQKGTIRKLNNLTHQKNKKVTRNFGGTNNELWCEGGERKFILDMVRESKKFAKTVFMFSTLVSKQSNVKAITTSLNKAEAKQIKTIAMGQGTKSSRIIAWTFLGKTEQENWVASRWN